MKINRNNYESFFIDYLEGSLDENLVDDFLEFLRQNPDLKNELTLLNSVSVEPEEITFLKKDKLFKEKYDSEEEFNNAALANLEGDSLEKEKRDFEKYISTHPEKEKDILLFEKTRLVPDISVVFSKKNKLFKHSAGRTVFLWSVRVAAVLTLAFTFYILIDKAPEKGNSSIEIATLEKEVNIKDPDPAPVVKPIQQEPEKQKQENVKKQDTKAPVKTVQPAQKQEKSLRETTTGRLEHDGLAETRIPVEKPATLNPLAADFTLKYPEVSLAAMPMYEPENMPVFDEERLLADAIVEKTGLDKINLNKITLAGLNLVSSLSKEKFQYETDEKGKVTEYNYDSRLLAFSIPAK